MKYLANLLCLFFASTLVLAGITEKKSSNKTTKFQMANAMENAQRIPKIVSIKKAKQSLSYKNKLKAPVGDVIGSTTYDLQTNSGMSRRVATHRNGRFTYVGWAFDFSFSAGAANRGSGFNYYDNNTGIWDNEPNFRIEPTTRTGWPNIGFVNGRQFSIAHTGAQGMIFTFSPANGNDWTEKFVGQEVFDFDGVWAKAVVDAPNIYCIIGRPASREPYNGINGGLNFIRSTDGGTTWESLGGLEDNYNDTYPLAMIADAYQLDATNDIVSVVYGSSLTSIVLYKSIDKGITWSKTIVLQNSNPLVKNLNENFSNPDYTVDPYFASDGGNAVIIDSEGTTHLVHSGRIAFNTADSDHIGTGGNYFLQRQVAALFYWNENMGIIPPQIIGKSIMNDANADGQLGNSLTTLIETGGMPYYSNMVCHPQLAIDANDNLYVSYSALVDGDYVPNTVSFLSAGTGEVIPYEAQFITNSVVYSDVFMLKSTNAGDNWQGPLNVTNAAESEETYPSIQRFIEDTIRLAYMHDPLPGTLLQGPQDLATINEIAVAKILPADISDETAPPDSEPYLTVLFPNLQLPQNCNVSNETSLREFAWGMDYPEGLLTDIKSRGLVDYSQIGNFVDEIYVEDSAGNQSDPVQIFVEIVPDEHAPLIEIDSPCSNFAVLAGTSWQTPAVKIIDLAEFNGSVEPSGCDVSENLVITDNVNTNETGTYTVNYSVADFAGNETTFVLAVNVIEADTEGPVITVENLPELIGMFEPFVPANVFVNAVDNVDCENVSINISGLEEVDTGILGDYEITITATDLSGNATVETRILKVSDTERPLIFLNEIYTILITDPNLCGTDQIFDRTDDPWVMASDRVDGDLTDHVTAIYNYGEGISCAQEGIYFVTYTVADASGNVAVADRLIEVDLPDCSVPPNTGEFDCNE